MWAWITSVAKSIFFNNNGTSLTSRNVEDAIKELSATASVSASPGYTWGGKGVVVAGSYLENDGVPSNITGRLVTLQSGYIERVFVTVQNAGTYSFDIQKRDGDVYTTIATVTLSGVRKNVFMLSNINVVYADELCVRISPSSAGNPANPDIGILMKGSI